MSEETKKNILNFIKTAEEDNWSDAFIIGQLELVCKLHDITVTNLLT